MDCPTCQVENPPQANFCLHCGARLVSRDVTLVSRLDVSLDRPQTYTARHVGDEPRATVEGERKQVTVLFCDIVRSSSLVMQLGAEGFHDLIGEFFALALDAVHRFEGTINQFLGDGFMALFGAPIAREDHTRRAILAALQLRAMVANTLGKRGVELRQGIGTGLVVVGNIGDDLRMDYTAFGDTTLLAARLQAGAAPGEILLSDEAAERVHGYFEFGGVTSVSVKERTVKCRSVLGLGPRRSRLEDSERTLVPFVGRASDMQFLRGGLAHAGQGKGQVIGVVGDPGVGKSRLVLEFRASLASGKTYEGRCASYGVAIPYLPIVDLLRETCGIDSADAQPVVADKLRAVLLRMRLDAEGSLPFLLYLLGQSAGVESLMELDPATVKGRTFEILRELWLAESRLQPLMLVIEDLHWVDRTSEEFLAALVNDVPEAPMLIVTTYRAGYIPPWRGKSWARELALGPLSIEASRAIVLATLSRTIDAGVTDTIVSRGEGNPFFLEELAQATRYHDDAFGRDVPQTVQEVLAARIDRLGDGPKHALQMASVLGRQFSLTLLDAVWDGGPNVRRDLHELKRLEFIFETDAPGGSLFTFKHALTQDVAYASLLEKRRHELHSRAGNALERMNTDHPDEQYELLAYHYARSDDRTKAAHYLILANRKAAQRNAMQEAIEYFYEALRVLEALPDTEENRRRRLRLVFDQTGEFHFLHRHQEYYDLILRHQTLSLEVNDSELLGAFYARLGHRQWTSGQIAESVPTLEHAVRLCETCGNSHDAAGAYAILAWAHLMTGNSDLVPFYRDKALEKIQDSFHPVWYSFARGAAILSYAWSGRWDDAVAEGELAMAEGRARSDSAIVSFSAGWVAHAYMHKRDWRRAQEYADTSFREAPTVYFQGFPQAFLARIACETGEVQRGIETLAQIEQMAYASGHRPAWGIFLAMLGEGYIIAQDWERASGVLEKLSALASQTPHSFFSVLSSRLLGEVACAEGHRDKAAMRLEIAIDSARRSVLMNELGLALAAFGSLRRTCGDTLAARTLLREALDVLGHAGTLEMPQRIGEELLELDSVA